MSFDAYIANFATDVLSNEQTVFLYNLFKRGQMDAYDKLVKSNMRLVVKIANDYRRYGRDFDDVVSDGTLGLLKAIDNFDPSKGEFSPYASVWINKHIKMGFDKARLVHAKRYDRMTEEERANMAMESLNEKMGDGETEFAERLESELPTPSEKVAMEDGVRVLLEAMDKVLDKREKFILRLRNGLGNAEPMTLEQIAGKLNCTRERVRQLEKIALGKVREYLER